MNTIHNINKGGFAITLLLYLTIYLGLCAQIALGALQLLFALCLFVKWDDLTFKHKKLLFIYWLLVVVYGFGMYFLNKHFNRDIYFIICFCFLPMSIAGYFVYVTNKLKQNL